MIEREKAIEILQRLADGKTEELNIFDDEGGGVCGQILEEQDAIMAGIEALKSERPHGEWGKWIINEVRCPVRCPKCLEYFYTDCYAKGELDKCPSCGADMRPKEGDMNE